LMFCLMFGIKSLAVHNLEDPFGTLPRYDPLSFWFTPLR